MNVTNVVFLSSHHPQSEFLFTLFSLSAPSSSEQVYKLLKSLTKPPSLFD